MRSSRRRFLAGALASAASLASKGSPPTTPDQVPNHAPGSPPLTGLGVPEAVLSAMATGVNLSHWFWYPHDGSEAGMRTFLAPGEAKALRSAGITSVRLPLEPGLLWTPDSGPLDPVWSIVRRSIDDLIAADLLVVVDAHAHQTPWADPKQPDFGPTFARFWTDLARSLAETDPNRVVLELLNEPHDLPDPATWSGHQSRLLPVLREHAPRHTLLATGDAWGGIDGLLRLQGPTFPNTIYSFHYYQPMTFTHQGATWGSENWRHLTDVPYPPTPERLALAREKAGTPEAKGEVSWYGEQAWSAAKIVEDLGRAADWSRKQRAPVWCGEFGVYRPHARDEDRLAWLRDASSAMKALGIGWSMWDYAGGFALTKPDTRTAAGARQLDADVLRALALAASVEAPR